MSEFFLQKLYFHIEKLFIALNYEISISVKTGTYGNNLALETKLYFESVLETHSLWDKPR